ncbi:MAG: hypothetical protein ACRD1G_18395, partial [Acidimicrobiales bacterium]
MTPPVSFDDRARTLTHSLLADATRVPSRLRRERVQPALWKAMAVFTGTVLVISGAVAGASIALRSGPTVTPIPASPGGHWKSFQLPALGSSLAAVSCPDTNYCVAVDYAGDWFRSTDPGGGAQAWKIASGTPITKTPSGNVTTGVSCVGRSLCVAVGVGVAVAVDQGGWVVVSRDLGGSPSEWTAILVDRHVALAG